MKKLLLILTLAIFSIQMNAQPSGTIAVQFYVDANSNCTYNFGEQLVYNVSFSLSYQPVSGGVQTTTFVLTPTIGTCGASTVYAYGSITPNNTLTLNSNSGVTLNPSCNNYTNLVYNSNLTQYIPVNFTSTSSIGTQVSYLNYYSSSGTYTYGNISTSSNTIGICSNIGNDSINMYFNIFNYLSCNSSASVSPRTYSLFLDGVNYDVLTTSGGFSSSSNTVGVNLLSKVQEYYQSNQTYLYLYPKLPTTFSVLGSHTFAVKSSIIYNNPLSTLNFSCILNSIPCTKISGKFYNDCNSNCIYDAGDNYGLGWSATGYVYNATGFNLQFHPNSVTGDFSVYLPTTNAY